MSQLTSLAVMVMKFGVAGLSGLAIDFGLTWLLKEKAGINKYIANSCGFITAAANNYVINRYWTFHSTKNWLPELGRFISIALIGLLISNLLIMYLQKRKFNFYLSKGVSVVCVFAWNFLCNYFFNF